MTGLAIHVACTAEEVRPLRPLVLRVYEEARVRSWPFLSDLLEAELRGVPGEEERAIVAGAVHALARYDRLLGFACRSEGAGARFDALFALAREGSTEAAEVEARLARVDDATEQLGIRYSFPDWLVALVADVALLARMNEVPPRVARVNTLRTTRDACVASLSEQGVSVRPTTHAPNGIVFEGRRSPFRTEAFARGDFEMQDEASQLVAEVVAPPPRSFVVDACAGAGGKTLALAAALEGRGKVTALDSSRGKLEELRRRARRAGASNVQALQVELASTLVELDAEPARVLVDAPCTGLGAVRRNPEARWRLRPEDVDRLGKAQRALTWAAASLVGKNGRLVYATCSFLPDEGEKLIDAFLAEHAEFRVMTVRDVMGRARTEGIATPDGKYLRTWQASGGGEPSMDGFFAAVLRRVA
jgi:16S rRNA (cytosine967-C5)-methyltransferase